MTDPFSRPPLLDRDAVRSLLVELGERLVARGVDAEVFVVGGSAVVFAYDGRRSTKDVDAVFRPRDDVLDEARAIAASRALPRDWLNDAVAVFLPPEPDPGAAELFVAPGVRICVASPAYLLAMKCMSGRQSEGDRVDAAELSVTTGIRGEAALERLVHRYFGPGPLGSVELWLEDIAAEADRRSARPSPAEADPGTA